MIMLWITGAYSECVSIYWQLNGKEREEWIHAQLIALQIEENLENERSINQQRNLIIPFVLVLLITRDDLVWNKLYSMKC